jgi:hypothetical protein
LLLPPSQRTTSSRLAHPSRDLTGRSNSVGHQQQQHQCGSGNTSFDRDGDASRRVSFPIIEIPSLSSFFQCRTGTRRTPTAVDFVPTPSAKPSHASILLTSSSCVSSSGVFLTHLFLTTVSCLTEGRTGINGTVAGSTTTTVACCRHQRKETCKMTNRSDAGAMWIPRYVAAFFYIYDNKLELVSLSSNHNHPCDVYCML